MPFGDAALFRLRMTVGWVGILPPPGVLGDGFKLDPAPAEFMVGVVEDEVSSEEQLGLGVTLALEGVVVSMVTVLSVSSSSPGKMKDQKFRD